MNKATLSKILSIVLTAVLALAAVFGYNVAIVQPQLAALQAQIAAAPPQFGTRGITHYSELSAADITATDDLTVGDAASITGALSAASVESSGAITGTTGNFSGAVSTGALSPSSVKSSGAITGTTGSFSGAVSGTAFAYPGQSWNFQHDTTANKIGIYSPDAGSFSFYVDSQSGYVYVTQDFFYPWETASSSTAITLTSTQQNDIWMNSGATGPVTFTLPGSTNERYCFFVQTAQNLVINPPDARQIYALTNASGDSITASTVGASICLITSVSGIVPIDVYGIWTDTN